MLNFGLRRTYECFPHYHLIFTWKGVFFAFCVPVVLLNIYLQWSSYINLFASLCSVYRKISVLRVHYVYKRDLRQLL